MKKLSTAILTGILVVSGVNCTKKENQTGTQQPTSPTLITPPGATSGELKKEDIVVGKGAEAVNGKKVSVNYTGWLTDGKEFDSSKNSGRPLEFVLGEAKVIKGWDDGLLG